MQAVFFYLLLPFLLLTSCKESDDSPETNVFPEFRASSLTVEELDQNNTISITVELSDSFSQKAIVSYASANGDAVSGSDYLNASGTIEFQPGEITKNINVTIVGDLLKEEQESFFINFSSGINVSLKTKQIEIIITDTDTETSIGFTDIGYSTPESYANYTLVWQDEFDGTSLNTADWTFEIGTGSNGWGNNELQYYREENTTVADGYLVIQARKESFGGQLYTSSRIKTEGKKEFKYGRVDIRAKLPKGKGIWPALWMLGGNFSTVGWPKCGEIDIMEMIGGAGNDNTVYGTLHWDNNGSYACTCEQNNDYTLSSGIFYDEFHVFSMIWNTNEISWYVDDNLFKTVDITPADLSEFQEQFFFIFNVAVGGNWPGSPDASTQFPQQMVVDYIRVFQ